MPLGVPGGEIAPTKQTSGSTAPAGVTIKPIDPGVAASYQNAPIAGNDPTSGIAYYLPGLNGKLGGPATLEQRAGQQQAQSASSALAAQIAAMQMGYRNANNQLVYDAALQQNAYRNDMARLNLDTNSDLARLGNARFRDVELAQRAADQALNSQGRRLDTSDRFATRRYGDTQYGATRRYGDTLFDATGQRDLALRRLQEQMGMAGRQYQQGNQFATADRDLSMRRAQLQMSMAGRAAANDAAARGAGASSGLGELRQDIRTQNDLDRMGTQNAFTRETYGNRLRLDDAQQATNRGMDEARFGFDTTMRQAGTARDLTIRGAATDRDQTFAQNSDAWADAQVDHQRQSDYIGSIAKDYNVNENQMRQALQLGAERLGLDHGTIIGKIANAISGNNSQASAAAYALQQQLLSAAQQGTAQRTPYQPSTSRNMRN